ncbi:hypothetical protein P3491_44170, partial [Vibrio parahaemolyticus]|nr:hypothetical protein [Vibrio parahaemolyticus]
GEVPRKSAATFLAADPFRLKDAALLITVISHRITYWCSEMNSLSTNLPLQVVWEYSLFVEN